MASREALVGELRARYEKVQETLRQAEAKHVEALKRVFQESGPWTGFCLWVGICSALLDD